MVLKVYISGMSGNKEVKKRQQRVLMILDSKNINYEVIDITEPGRESDKEFMQTKSSSNGATVSDPEPRHALPPQIFNEQMYCGDYDAFDLANEIDTLDEFLKIASAAKTADSVTGVQTELTPHVQNAAKENGEENDDDKADEKADENADDKPKENGENQSNGDDGTVTIADDQNENNDKPEHISLSNESSESIREELKEKTSKEQQPASDDFNNPIGGLNETIDSNITNQSSTKQQNTNEKTEEISNITSKIIDSINNMIPCSENSVVEAIVKDDDVHSSKTEASANSDAIIMKTETDGNEISKESQLELTETDAPDVLIEGDSVDKVLDVTNLDVDIHNSNEIKVAEDNIED